MVDASLNENNVFLFDSDSFPVALDSGASSTSTSNKEDFIPGTFAPLDGVSVLGIASGLNVSGYYTVSWNFYTIKGEVVTLKIEKVLHAPGLPSKLLSPQQTCQQCGGSIKFTLDATSAQLSTNGQIICVPFDCASNYRWPALNLT